MTKFKRKTKIERQIEIRDAAIQVFNKKGYRNTTMEDVVNRTSLSKGGVYRYYSSTKDILIDIMRFGNEYRLNIYRELTNKLSNNASFDEIYLNMAINKLYDEKPYMDLYSMFISEIIYDEKMKDLFRTIERESINNSLEFLRNHLSLEEIEKIKDGYILFSRIMNALLFFDHLFSEENVLVKNKEKVHQIVKLLIE